jgi:hypothetical protein
MDTLFPEQDQQSTPSSTQQSKRQKHLLALGILVTTMLEHYFVTDLTEQERKVIMADWQVALEPLPLQAVKEARRRWLETKDKRPTIAQFVRLTGECGGYSDDDAAARAMPAPEWLGPVRKVPYGELDADERWCWHARMRVSAERLGIEGPDPEGKWRNTELERQARAELPPLRLKETYVTPPMPDDPDTVRPDWQSIRAPDLTPAEMRLHEPAAERMLEALGGALVRRCARDDAAFDPAAAPQVPLQQPATPERAAALSAHLGMMTERPRDTERQRSKARAQEDLDRAFEELLDDEIPF